MTFSREANVYVAIAVRARSRVLETQSARWVIMAEQGHQADTRALDDEVLTIASRSEWLAGQQEANVTARMLRSQQVVGREPDWNADIPARTRAELEQYVGCERYWQPVAELLVEGILNDLTVMLSAVVRAEESRKTPTDLDRELTKCGLAPHLNYIEVLMFRQGLYEPHMSSAAPLHSDTSVHSR